MQYSIQSKKESSFIRLKLLYPPSCAYSPNPPNPSRCSKNHFSYPSHPLPQPLKPLPLLPRQTPRTIPNNRQDQTIIIPQKPLPPPLLQTFRCLRQKRLHLRPQPLERAGYGLGVVVVLRGRRGGGRGCRIIARECKDTLEELREALGQGVRGCGALPVVFAGGEGEGGSAA